MIDQFSTRFNQELSRKFTEQAGDVIIESITIADGKMTIVAHKR
jgi:hypothetical protein